MASVLEVTPEEGLTDDQVRQRLDAFGTNTLRQKKRASKLRIFLAQMSGPIVALLAIAAAVAVAFGEWQESLAIVAVLIINAAIGFFTELRAVQSMAALRALGTQIVRVRRHGQISEVSAVDIVPGDVVILEGGDVAPADIRLMTASNLYVDEAALTGESLAVEKSTSPSPRNTPVAERQCMIHKGTSLTRGSATGIVISTGMNTELGHISQLVLEAAPQQTPLEEQLKKLGGQLIWITLALTTLVGGIGILVGQDTFLMIQAAIALAVAAIPEGLPIVATMALARGMWRMAKHNALIERLSAVETLGATTVICADKTGTLTENKMTVQKIILAEREIELDLNESIFTIGGNKVGAAEQNELVALLAAGGLCNNAELNDRDGTSSGDPLEIALLEAAKVAGLSKHTLLRDAPRIKEIAFDSIIKKMATVHKTKTGLRYYIKGAPEAVIGSASQQLKSTGPEALTEDMKREWLFRINKLAELGLRVLAFAEKTNDIETDEPFADLTFLGVVGLYDPPRPEVKGAIAACHGAGIRVIMITGDHAVTAKSIAAAVGIRRQDLDIVEGQALKPIADLTDQDRQKILDAEIFARVSPAQKLDLVTIYQDAGEIVAMTGDGVNDAPALKKADIGVAMGLRGTQVAREAAAMVLKDDAFPTIVEAIREGRVIFRNIQRFAAYLLSCNLSEVLVVGVAILAGLPLPLLPLQILYLNLVTDVFPAFALATGHGDKAILDRPPREPQKPILTRGLWIQIVGTGLLITATTFGAALLGRVWFQMSPGEVLTISFLTIAFSQLWHVFNMRDRHAKRILNDITRNPFIWAAIGISIFLVLIVVYVPSFSTVLQLTPPSADAWSIIILASLVPLLGGQIGKEISRLREEHKRIRET